MYEALIIVGIVAVILVAVKFGWRVFWGLMLVGLIVLGYFNFGVAWILFFAIWLPLGTLVEVCRLATHVFRKIEKW